MPAAVGTIAGTWGRGDPDDVSGSLLWWRPPSVFIANLTHAGLSVVSETDYYDWSTNLDGVRGRNDDWQTSGKALYWWWVAQGRPSLSLIGHSHAAQVIACALQYSSTMLIPMRLDHLVTVGSPVREDMDIVWERTRWQIDDWTHLYTEEVFNLFNQDLGYQEIGSRPHSGNFPFTRLMRHADRNVEIVPAVTHHGLILSHLWNEKDIWRFLKDSSYVSIVQKA